MYWSWQTGFMSGFDMNIIDATNNIRDLADEWHYIGQPVKLRRSTVYILCEIVDDTEELLDILNSLPGATFSTRQRNVINRVCNELNDLKSRDLI